MVILDPGSLSSRLEIFDFDCDVYSVEVDEIDSSMVEVIEEAKDRIEQLYNLNLKFLFSWVRLPTSERL